MFIHYIIGKTNSTAHTLGQKGVSHSPFYVAAKMKCFSTNPVNYIIRKYVLRFKDFEKDLKGEQLSTAVIEPLPRQHTQHSVEPFEHGIALSNLF